MEREIDVEVNCAVKLVLTHAPQSEKKMRKTEKRSDGREENYTEKDLRIGKHGEL
jgi:hypothetical protein